MFTRAELNATLSELVGYKAGLALNQEQLASHIDDHYAELLLGDVEEVVTIRSEDAEEVVSQLLYAVGSTPTRTRVLPGADIYRQLRGDAEDLARYKVFQKILLAEFDRYEPNSEPFDFTPVLEASISSLGVRGGEIALMFFDSMQVSLIQNPWAQIRHVEWNDIVQLDELFQSESLKTAHGKYLDQRFIDYLASNFSSIDEMNWRKFEGLTCEFFERAGYRVAISEGRNDGGIDARVWTDQEGVEGPPTILVQCKRQRTNVEKVVVKALWADVVDERAEAGLIVTTSALAPGAERVASARAYPIHQADRRIVRQWVEAMRTPLVGVFLGL